MHMGHMKMSAWFGADCTFIIKEFTTDSSQYGLFILGCLITLVISAFH
jgi:hypothetical protein